MMSQTIGLKTEENVQEDWQKFLPSTKDELGRRIYLTRLVAQGVVDATTAADYLSVKKRKVQEYVRRYKANMDSCTLVDRRRFCQGQKKAYRMDSHNAEAVNAWVMKLLRDETTSSRSLAHQLDWAVSDRTIDRFLQKSGLRGAEELGLRENVALFLQEERQKAYWAGVAAPRLLGSEPLSGLEGKLPAPSEWQEPSTGQTGIALGLVHLVRNGAYTSLATLTREREGHLTSQSLNHGLILYLLASGGERLSQAKSFVWFQVSPLLANQQGLSASTLRHYLITLAEQAKELKVVQRESGAEETISLLRDYQEESVAQRFRRGLINANMIFLDDYVNSVYRKEAIAKTKHGTQARIVKAFRRHMTQDIETNLPVTCPVGRSNITPQEVLSEVVSIVNGGLQRVEPNKRLGAVVADRWWSSQPVLQSARSLCVGLLVWAKKHKSVKEALARLPSDDFSPVDSLNKEPKNSVQPATEQKQACKTLDTAGRQSDGYTHPSLNSHCESKESASQLVEANSKEGHKSEEVRKEKDEQLAKNKASSFSLSRIVQRLFNPLSSLFGRRDSERLPDENSTTEPVVNFSDEHQKMPQADTQQACTANHQHFAQEESQKGAPAESQTTAKASPESQPEKIKIAEPQTRSYACQHFAQEESQKEPPAASQVIVKASQESLSEKIKIAEEQTCPLAYQHFAQEESQKGTPTETQVIVKASQENQHQKVPSKAKEQAIPYGSSKSEIRNNPRQVAAQFESQQPHQAKIPPEKEPVDSQKQKEPLAPSVDEHHLPHAQPATDKAKGQAKESETMSLMRLDSEIQIYDLDEPVRAVVDWDSDGEKVARLVVGIEKEELDSSAVHHCLRFRQRIEIMIKSLHRRLQLPHFGGGEALLTYSDLPTPDEAQVKKWLTNLRQMETRMKNSQERLKTVERELSLIQEDKEPTNSLLLGLSDLKALAKRLRAQVERQGKRIEELRHLLSWANGQSEPPEQKGVAELCLTREAILTQLKLDVFTAQETLIDEFIQIGLMPVLYEEAKKQAAERKRKAKRSTAKSKKGQLLCTDIEQLVQTKLANIERETILLRLLRQPGEFVRLKQKRLILCVFQRFPNKRMQAAFEHYCLFLNQQACCLPIDEGPPWRVLFTYHKTGPSY